MKALQDAVPEDVRGKLMTAVSGIVRAEGSDLKFDRPMGIGKAAKSKTQDKERGVAASEGLNIDPPLEDQAAKLEPELGSSENVQKSIEAGQPQSTNSHQGDISSTVRKNTVGSENNSENNVSNSEKSVPGSDSSEKRSDSSTKSNSTGLPGKVGGTEEAGAGELKVHQDGGVARLETMAENSNQKSEEKTLDTSADQNKMSSPNVAEEAILSPGSSSEAQPDDNQKRENKSLQPAVDQNKSNMADVNPNKSLDSSADQNKMTPANVTEEAGLSQGSSSEVQPNDDQRRENKTVQPAADQNKPNTADVTANKSPAPDNSSPTFGVTQALDALTGMDDSTQMAVNSVFGVIENMISQLERQNDEKVVKDEEVDGGSEKQRTGIDHAVENNEDNRNELSVEYENPTIYDGSDSIESQGNSSAKHLDMEKKKKSVDNKLLADYSDKLRYVHKSPVQVPLNLNGDYLQHEYFHKYLHSNIPNAKPLNSDATNALFLDYFPEEGQWKLFEQPENVGESATDSGSSKHVNKEDRGHSYENASDADEFIEPSYVVLDTDQQQEPVVEYEPNDNMEGDNALGGKLSEELRQFVKHIILDSLKLEVDRRINPSDRKDLDSDLARDIATVADAVSLAILQDAAFLCLDGENYSIDSLSEKVGTLNAENTINAISSAAQDTSYLRGVVPVGVIVGSSLAALREHLNVFTEHDDGQKDLMVFDPTKKSERRNGKPHVSDTDQMPTDKKATVSDSRDREGTLDGPKISNNNNVMVGAVTAALGASALLVNQSVRVTKCIYRVVPL